MPRIGDEHHRRPAVPAASAPRWRANDAACRCPGHRTTSASGRRCAGGTPRRRRLGETVAGPVATDRDDPRRDVGPAQLRGVVEAGREDSAAGRRTGRAEHHDRVGPAPVVGAADPPHQRGGAGTTTTIEQYRSRRSRTPSGASGPRRIRALSRRAALTVVLVAASRHVPSAVSAGSAGVAARRSSAPRGRPPGGRPGPGTASRRRSRGRPRGRSGPSRGRRRARRRPRACRSGRVARPSSTAIAHQRADAVAVERLERRDPEDAQVQVAAEEARLDVVAGEAPASSGSGRWCRRRRTRRPRRSGRPSARRAAPRSSCRSACALDAGRAATSASTASASSRTISSSCTAPTSGTMISGARVLPCLLQLARPPRRSPAPACANRPGMTSPRRTPRRPSIGFCSCSRRTASSSARSCLVGVLAASPRRPRP